MRAFGSPFVDSKRTAVTEETTKCIQIFYLRPSLAENECIELLQTAGKMFCQISGGDYEPFIIKSDEQKLYYYIGAIENEDNYHLAEGVKLKSVLTKKISELTDEIH